MSRTTIRLQQYARVALAAQTLIDADYAEMLACYDTDKGHPETDFAEECPEEYVRWKELIDALQALG